MQANWQSPTYKFGLAPAEYAGSAFQTHLRQCFRACIRRLFFADCSPVLSAAARTYTSLIRIPTHQIATSNNQFSVSVILRPKCCLLITGDRGRNIRRLLRLRIAERVRRGNVDVAHNPTGFAVAIASTFCMQTTIHGAVLRRAAAARPDADDVVKMAMAGAVLEPVCAVIPTCLPRRM